ncbi:MAG: CooT family nickel-binding protein [Candidatus Hadarchaeales archaeon]
MCIATVKSGEREIKDVVLIEEREGGYVVTTLLGERVEIKGKIRKIDMEQHLVLLE